MADAGQSLAATPPPTTTNKQHMSANANVPAAQKQSDKNILGILSVVENLPCLVPRALVSKTSTRLFAGCDPKKHRIMSSKDDDAVAAKTEASEKRSSSENSKADSPNAKKPEGKVKSIILQVCTFVLVTELCERLAYYGLTGSLPVFFSKIFKLPDALSTEMNTLFGSLNYVTPLLGAYVADKYLGRFKTIGIFCILYVVGMVLCVLGSVPDWSGVGEPLFFVGLFLGVAVGAGGIKPNVVVLGADQFDLTIEDERKQKDRFFNYFYWCINIGAAIAFGGLANLAVNGMPPEIPEQWGFFWSFLIPAIAMGLAVITFFSGAKRLKCCCGCYMGGYKMVPPQKSALGDFFVMFGRAASQTSAGWCIISAAVALLLGFLTTITSYFIPTAPSNTTEEGTLEVDAHFIVAVVGMLFILYACMIFILVGGKAQWMHEGYQLWAEKQDRLQQSKESGSKSESLLDGRRVSYGAAENVEAPVDQFESIDMAVDGDDDPLAKFRKNTELLDACEVIRLLPYFAYIVVFWAVYGQMSNNFIVQGCQMNLFWAVDPASSTAQVSSAFLNLFDTVVILAFIPVFDGVIYPLIGRCRRKKGALTVLEKVGSGFFFCTLSMIAAGVIEILRKESGTFPVDPCCIYSANATELTACCGGNTTCSDSCDYNSHCASQGSIEEMSRLSIWWQAFQFLLIGISEILTSVSSYELFYTQVPESMRSICQALNLLTTSIGFMVTGGVNSVFQFWIPDNLNHGKLENVYFIIGGLSLFAGIGYIFTAQSFVYSDQLREHLTETSEAGSIAGPSSNDHRRGSSLDGTNDPKFGGRSVSAGSRTLSGGRSVSVGSSRATSFNPRAREWSVNSQSSVRSRSRSRYTHAVSGLTCASVSGHTARALALVDPPVNAMGETAPPLPQVRSNWFLPSRSVSGASGTALPEHLLSAGSSEPKATTEGAVVGQDQNLQQDEDEESAVV